MSLVVYRSSAGTGKTTTLVSEYLRISLSDPSSFRNILAITFTNKAAKEMKTRVLEVLKILSENPSILKNEYGSLINDLALDENILKLRASMLLSMILHSYDDFAISTIDSFIHKIIRTFANDVGLPQNFEVVIDKDDFVPDIVSLLYEKVGSDEQLTKLLVDFVITNADEESSYDPTRELISFIEYQMREDSFTSAKLLENLEIHKLGEIISVVKSYMQLCKNDAVNDANLALKIITENNLDAGDFFQGNKGILGFYKKVSDFKGDCAKLFPGKNAEKTILEGKWFSSKVNAGAKVAIENIADDLTEYYTSIVNNLKGYLYYHMVSGKIYSVALVNEIRKIFDEYTALTGKVHISDFNKKISAEIADQPVPYIYERLGRKFRYFLIDEFQDTSLLQWNNLLPLIEESLSYGRFNMLVGDAKQAIYRFRSGEVELFARLPELYGIEKNRFTSSRQELIKREFSETVLSVNWRSNREIIEFNNHFFEAVLASATDYIKGIYKNHSQKVPDIKMDSGGFVSLNLIDSENALQYASDRNIRVLEIVNELIQKKYELKDICILCRTSRGAISISEFLLENDIDVVSSESLLLINSPKVRLIIAVFKLIWFPNDPIAAAEFIQCLMELGMVSDFDHEYTCFCKFMQNGISGLFKYLNIDDESDVLCSYNVYEMSEFIIVKIIDDFESDPFLQNFLDYTIENTDALDIFLEKWESRKHKLFITMPEDLDAIKIMTIHKAKGLKFPVVILETTGMTNRKTVTEYWEPAQISGAEELKVTMLPLKRELELINRGHVYEKETEKTELDNLNLIYVAFTRPVEALYTISRSGGRGAHLLSKYIEMFVANYGTPEKDGGIYNIGTLNTHVVKSDDNKIEKLSLEKLVSFQWDEHINIAESRDSGLSAISQIAKNEYGSIIHDYLSKIIVADDVGVIISNVESVGILSENDCHVINQILLSVVNHPQLAYLYGKEVDVKNEADIVLKNGELIRPDRIVFTDDKIVVLDYKTGEKNESHKLQMQKYTLAISEIYNKKIESILVYIGDEIILEYC